MRKQELVVRNRIYKRSQMALARVADIERQIGIIYDNANADDGCIAAHIFHDLTLVKSSLEKLRDRNRL